MTSAKNTGKNKEELIKKDAKKKAASEKNAAETEGGESLSIEESFKRLDEILLKMEDEDCPLEESFALYERGIKLIKACNESIEKVEKRLEVIRSDEGLFKGGDE